MLFGAGEGTTLGSFGGRVDSFLTSIAPDIGTAADECPPGRFHRGALIGINDYAPC